MINITPSKEAQINLQSTQETHSASDLAFIIELHSSYWLPRPCFLPCSPPLHIAFLLLPSVHEYFCILSFLPSWIIHLSAWSSFHSACLSTQRFFWSQFNMPHIIYSSCCYSWVASLLLKVAFKARYSSITSFETSKRSFQWYMEDLHTIFIIFGQGSLLSSTRLKELGVYPFNKLKSFINLLPFSCISFASCEKQLELGFFLCD